MTRQGRAERPADAAWTFDPFTPVEPGDPWYVDVDALVDRDRYGVTRKLVRDLAPSPTRPEFVQLGIVGHKGTGKTTHVRTAMQRLEGAGTVPVYVNALESFDQAGLAFPDIILVLVRSVAEMLESQGVDVDAASAGLVRQWFSDELLTETHRKELVGEIGIETGGALGIPFLAKLASKVTAVFRSDNEYRTEIRRRAERDPADLIRRANGFLDAAHQALRVKHQAPREIAVVFDSLEKLDRRAIVDAAVLRRADDFRRLRCHLLFFLDPADQYAPQTVRADEAFRIISVPMLPIRKRNDPVDRVDEGVEEAVRQVIDRRASNAAVFDPPGECVREVARLSGGRIRDVLHLARLAVELSEPDPATPDHIRRAARRLCNQRTTVALDAHWARLARIHRDRAVTAADEDGVLLLHSLVLHYNDEGWWDVHPLVRLDPRFEVACRRLEEAEPPPISTH